MVALTFKHNTMFNNKSFNHNISLKQEIKTTIHDAKVNHVVQLYFYDPKITTPNVKIHSPLKV